MKNNDYKSPLLDDSAIRRGDVAAAAELARRIAAQIEEERSKIKGLKMSKLSSPKTIERVKKLETLITLYMRLAVGAVKRSGGNE